MTLTLSPELEQEIRVQAAKRGITPEDFVLSKLSDLRSQDMRSSSERLQAMLDYFRDHAVDVKVAPGVTYSREEIYSDHD